MRAKGSAPPGVRRRGDAPRQRIPKGGYPVNCGELAERAQRWNTTRRLRPRVPLAAVNVVLATTRCVPRRSLLGRTGRTNREPRLGLVSVRILLPSR